jgi:hypothetical protein
MAIKYDTFKTSITGRELSLILSEAFKIVSASSSPSIGNSTSLHTMDFVRKNTNPGACMICSSTGVNLIGAAVFDISERTWFVLEGTTVIVFLDGKPEFVNKLGFSYDADTGNVTHPYIGDRVLFTIT